MNLIPLFNFPAKVIFIDDNEELLKSYKSLNLPNIVDYYENPIKALKYINHKNNQDSHNELLNIYQNNSINEMIIVNDIEGLIKSKEKYNCIGQIVTDYKMPNLNGVELCKSIVDRNIKKILLTGEYEPLDVVKDLSDEVVNHYLQKGKKDLDNDLILAIKKTQKKFFLSLTNDIKVDILNNLNFANLFDNINEKYKFNEYYLYTKTGCFIFLNDNGYHTFNVYTDEDIDYISQMLNLNDVQLNFNKRNQIPNAEIFLYPDKPIFNNCEKYKNYYYNVIKSETL